MALTRINLSSSAVTGTLPIANGGTAATTLAGAGLTSIAFYGRQGSAQTLSRGSETKLTGFTSEEIDTDTAFDGTTFTVPSGGAGKYLIGALLNADFESAGQDGEQVTIRIYKNGSEVLGTRDINSGSGRDMQLHGSYASCILDLSVGNTVEAYAILSDASSSGTLSTRAGSSSFFGHKLIGA